MKTQNGIETALIAHVVSECRAINVEERFDEMLDQEGEVNVSGLTFWPSRIWREMDPTAHRCGCNDYADGEDWYEIDGDYYERREVDAARDEFVAELESEVAALEAEIEELEEEDAERENEERENEEQEDNAARILGLSARLDTLRANVATAESYSF